MPVNSSIRRLALTLFLISVFLISAKASPTPKDDKHQWCYKDPKCAPLEWKTGQCRTGKSQSPVDFNEKNIIGDKKELRLRFNKDYMEVQEHFFVKNNGHTLQVQLNEDYSSKLLLDGDGLKGSYVFSQLHFHWGSHDDVGSEHTVKGVAHSAELHLVHYGASYKSLTEAAADTNHRALAVLGIFLEISSEDNPSLKPIIDAMGGAQNVSDDLKTVHAPFNVTALLPKDLGIFRYYGSLTTPSCNEIVHWNVFRKTVPISRAQLEAFRNIRDGHGDKMVDNFRPTLPTGNRKIREYEFVRRGLKPEMGAADEKKPSPDDDYDDAMKTIDDTAKPKTPSDKKNSASGNHPGSLTTSLLFAFSTVAIIVPRLKIN